MMECKARCLAAVQVCSLLVPSIAATDTDLASIHTSLRFPDSNIEMREGKRGPFRPSGIWRGPGSNVNQFGFVMAKSDHIFSEIKQDLEA